MAAEPSGTIDRRFSDPEAQPTPWADTERALHDAELYWLTTVRADSRPHVTPLIGVAHDGAMHFCTGLDEQKARNLEHHRDVALITGSNAWAAGLDVVVEGTAIRAIGHDRLQAIADAFEAKYGSVWHFDVVGDTISPAPDAQAAVFRIEARKILAFAKDPHAQTTYRFTNR